MAVTFREFVNSLNEKSIEGKLIPVLLLSLAVSVAVGAIFFFVFVPDQLKFMQKYLVHAILAILSYAILMPAVYQVLIYKKFPCMSGMMIGMTFGMIASFLPGFYLGATNGMFWGGVFGMIVGIGFGIWKGSCCGVMGFMEGIMAGFMGGLMGAMSAVMMLNDNLVAAGIVVFVIGATIMTALYYMIYSESREHEIKKIGNYWAIVLLSAILTLVTLVFMVFGPRSYLFS